MVREYPVHAVPRVSNSWTYTSASDAVHLYSLEHTMSRQNVAVEFPNRPVDLAVHHHDWRCSGMPTKQVIRWSLEKQTEMTVNWDTSLLLTSSSRINTITPRSECCRRRGLEY